MSFLTPEAFFASVLDIDANALVKQGYRAVLLDFDNTVLPRKEQRIAPDVAAWIESLRTAGLKTAFLSNTNNARVLYAAKRFQIGLVRNAFKPLTGGYVRACALLGVACSDALMIGDQCYTDVLGAHRVGMDAIMVRPQNTNDPIHTRALRLLDALAVRGVPMQGGGR